ncbi:hypothetical protein FM106_03715 [Brachybacterium faecium]|nr:hypothetical protein FM106_03715 [Brachybacterium faecium]
MHIYHQILSSYVIFYPYGILAFFLLKYKFLSFFFYFIIFEKTNVFLKIISFKINK